ncbi:uncharacterized protein MYCGRDRAFT_66192 [Zymoseptoria tritici IPO323]|uniref:Large ribosomal subunit protein bL21m n=1 Tax=Zymoseptoria tritici (strain CBS 115943 / IPO323) TaxID=336722 RepID=F9X069_ZYMTI|nr:uncharacterized protein MYCGRDRAFT_66192 [Zymoseptoria tritici IPO323]EGP92323.1 hypothetical protein MYCGRDRAFT_66192 [Zymoseptoria tritici IPO323]
MLSRTLRRTLLDARYSLPPTYLLPWTAGLTTATQPPQPSEPPPELPSSSIPARTNSTRSESATAKSQNAEHLELPAPHSQSSGQTSSPPQLSESVRELLPLLRSQGPHYMTVHIHGNPYLITEGDTVRLPFLMQGVEPGDVIRLNRAINLGSRDYALKAPAASPKMKSPTTATFSYVDDRMFVCRAVVTGVESEPMRIKEKTKRRQRHVKKVKSKHRYTIIKIKELRVKSVEEIESGEVD